MPWTRPGGQSLSDLGRADAEPSVIGDHRFDQLEIGLAGEDVALRVAYLRELWLSTLSGDDGRATPVLNARRQLSKSPKPIGWPGLGP